MTQKYTQTWLTAVTDRDKLLSHTTFSFERSGFLGIVMSELIKGDTTWSFRRIPATSGVLRHGSARGKINR